MNYQARLIFIILCISFNQGYFIDLKHRLDLVETINHIKLESALDESNVIVHHQPATEFRLDVKDLMNKDPQFAKKINPLNFETTEVSNISERYLYWDFDNISNIIILTVCDVTVNTNQYIIITKSKEMILEYEIPTFYNIVRQCEGIKNHSFFLFSHGTIKCRYNYVLRPPTEMETEHLKQNLLDYLVKIETLA